MSNDVTPQPPTIVGIDGTTSSAKAARWAWAHTDALGPVHLVACWEYPLVGLAATAFGGAPLPPPEDMADAAQEAAETFAASLDMDAPLTVVNGFAGATLCDAAEDTSALVIGTRGRGPLRANLAGSVSRWCADHAPVPLVIVPDLPDVTTPSLTPRVVVGVDGSPTSVAALRWAATTFPDSEIVALTSWQTIVDGPVMFSGARFDLTVFRANARAIVEEAADKVCADLGIEADRITREITEGDPRWTLLHAQDDADLLVIGRRGRSGLAHLVLGSTTTSLIHQPRCPIAVVPVAEEVES